MRQVSSAFSESFLEPVRVKLELGSQPLVVQNDCLAKVPSDTLLDDLRTGYGYKTRHASFCDKYDEFT